MSSDLFKNPESNCNHLKLKIAEYVEKDKQAAVKKAIRKIGAYILKNEVDALMIIDRSARPAGECLNAYFIDNNAEKVPNIYYTNPNGYKKTDGLGHALKYERPVAEIDSDFKQSYPTLKPDEKILVLDTCIHEGDTIKPIIYTLERNGFKHILVGVLNANRKNFSHINPDVIGGFNKCKPFREPICESLPSTSVSSVVSLPGNK